MHDLELQTEKGFVKSRRYRSSEVLRGPARYATYEAELPEPELLSLEVQISRDVIGPVHAEQLLYLLLTLRAPRQVEAASLPINLCLVIDCSTSMRGVRLDRVKAAARQVVGKLSPRDTISIVSFSDRAEVVSRNSNIADNLPLIQRISAMRASGGTEIFQGLVTGVVEMSKASLSEHINQLVLMTDGHTYGDEEQCISLAHEAAIRGITFSAFGIGSDWNDVFLDQLVTPSGGNSTYIENPTQIVEGLQRQIEGLDATYARNVRLQKAMAAGVEIKYAMRLSPSPQPLSTRRDEIMVGSVEVRQPLVLLLELVVQPQIAGNVLRLSVRVRADVPKAHLHDHTFAHDHSVSVTSGATNKLPPPAILQAVQMLNLYRMSERAWNSVNEGQTKVASQRMKRLTERLMDLGQTELANDALAEMQRLTISGALSTKGRKKLKYGTRSLLTHALRLTEDEQMS